MFLVAEKYIMSKKFVYVSEEDRFNAIQNAAWEFVEHRNADIVEVMKGVVDPRKEFSDLFDFDTHTMRADVYEKVKANLLDVILKSNSGFDAESEHVTSMVDSSIKTYIDWLKRRNECGPITWDDFRKRLYKIDLKNSRYGIRFQTFGKCYVQMCFNGIDIQYGDGKDLLRLYRADCEKSPEGTVINANDYVIISGSDIKEISMGYADLMYRSGLRDVTIEYGNGESHSFRFSDDN